MQEAGSSGSASAGVYVQEHAARGQQTRPRDEMNISRYFSLPSKYNRPSAARLSCLAVTEVHAGTAVSPE